YELRNELRTVQYARCFVLSATFSGPNRMGEVSGVHFADSPVEWVTDNQARAVSPVGPALTALSTGGWAEEHWEETDEAVTAQLIGYLVQWAEGEPRDVRLHRWACAQPTAPLSVPCMVACPHPPLLLAGDGFAASVAPRVEAAYTSGLAAANRALQLLRRREPFPVQRRVCRYLLEVGVTNPNEAICAQMNGADRVELCSALEVGGLTPSRGLFRVVRDRIRIPIYVLLRPRTGGFTYSDELFETMRQDAEWYMREGANGIVFGILRYAHGRNSIDRDRCRELVRLAGGRAVFHRAFDFLPDPLQSLEELIDLRFYRVQTSGARTTAEGGMERLQAWIAHAGWQIAIMPAGGITPAMVADLLRVTQADQVHASLRRPVPDPSLVGNARLAEVMGGRDAANSWLTTDPDLVRRMREQLDWLAQQTVPEAERGEDITE